MSEDKSSCLSYDEMEEFITNEEGMDEDRLFIIYDHFGRCKDCADQAKVMMKINNFFSSWNAKSHGEAIRRMGKEPAVSNNRGKYITAIQVITEKGDNLLKLLYSKAEDFKDSLDCFSSSWSVSYAGTRSIDPLPALDIAGATTPAISTLPMKLVSKFAWNNKILSDSVIAVSETGEKSVTITTRNNNVVIKLEDFEKEGLPLIYMESDKKERLYSKYEFDSEQNCWISSFIVPPEGHYLLLIEEGIEDCK